MPLIWPDKDPDDIWDVGYEVTGFEEGLSIATSEATVVAGTVSIVSHRLVPGTMVTRTRLSGGAVGEVCEVRVRTTMSDGQRVDQTMRFSILER